MKKIIYVKNKKTTISADIVHWFPNVLFTDWRNLSILVQGIIRVGKLKFSRYVYVYDIYLACVWHVKLSCWKQYSYKPIQCLPIRSSNKQ